MAETFLIFFVGVVVGQWLQRPSGSSPGHGWFPLADVERLVSSLLGSKRSLPKPRRSRKK